MAAKGGNRCFAAVGGGYGFSSTLEIVESPTQWLGAQSLRLYKIRVSCACTRAH